MGVPQIWEYLKPYVACSRVPVRQFVSDYVQKNGRSPRIAIDGYSWVFECGFIIRHGSTVKYATHGTIGKAVLNFLNKLKEMMSLNVNFLLVFDGDMKPYFKHNFSEQPSTKAPPKIDINNFKELWQRHAESHDRNGKCLSLNVESAELDFMSIIKQLLDLLHISYIEACGEGEAQCAWLQASDIVDYVLSNDSDTLTFGCTRMLKNYSKSKDDFGATAASHLGQKDGKRENFVTVVDLQEINKSNDKVGFTRQNLLLFSILMGADYNKGVKGLGKKKAFKLAQLESPNFAQQLHEIFSSLDSDPTTIKSRYSHFCETVFKYCQNHSKDLFGRNYTTLLGQKAFEGWPSTLAVMYYFHPFIMPTIESSLLKPHNVNIGSSMAYLDIDFSTLEAYLTSLSLPSIKNFHSWYHNYVLECFLLRFIIHCEIESTSLARIVDDKDIGTSPGFWKVKYNNFLPLDTSESIPSPRKTTTSRSRSPLRRELENMQYSYSSWVPKGLIPEDHLLIKNYKRDKAVYRNRSPSKRSPKKISVQTSNLDKFLENHASPIKVSDNVVPPICRSPKRRLFIEEQESTNSEDDLNDSSLIIIGERATPFIDVESSPISETEVIESPFKKQRNSDYTPRTIPKDQGHIFQDSPLRNKEAGQRTLRGSSILDEIELTANDDMTQYDNSNTSFDLLKL